MSRQVFSASCALAMKPVTWPLSHACCASDGMAPPSEWIWKAYQKISFGRALLTTGLRTKGCCCPALGPLVWPVAQDRYTIGVADPVVANILRLWHRPSRMSLTSSASASGVASFRGARSLGMTAPSSPFARAAGLTDGPSRRFERERVRRPKRKHAKKALTCCSTYFLVVCTSRAGVVTPRRHLQGCNVTSDWNGSQHALAALFSVCALSPDGLNHSSRVRLFFFGGVLLAWLMVWTPLPRLSVVIDKLLLVFRFVGGQRCG